MIGDHLDLEYYARLREFPNEEIRRTFAWRVPERMNAAAEICDRHAEAGAGLAIRWLGADGSARDVGYDELRELSNRAANALRGLGVTPGEWVFTVLSRIPEHWVTLIGTLKCGGIMSCLSTTFGEDAIAVRISDATPKVVVTIAKHAAHVEPAARAVGATVVLADDDGPGGLRDRLEGVSDDFDLAATRSDDPAFLYYTSGTTGTPKGSLHAHAQIAGALGIVNLTLDLRPDDVFWPTSDLAWVTGVLLTSGDRRQATA